MKIFRYSVSFRNCYYEYVTKNGYTIAENNENAMKNVIEEYGDCKIYLFETKVIETE